MPFCRLPTLLKSFAPSQNRLASKVLKNAGIAGPARDVGQQRPMRVTAPGNVFFAHHRRLPISPKPWDAKFSN
jgi:hypothetical protein